MRWHERSVLRKHFGLSIVSSDPHSPVLTLIPPRWWAIIARQITEDLQLAASAHPDIKLKEYVLSVVIKDA